MQQLFQPNKIRGTLAAMLLLITQICTAQFSGTLPMDGTQQSVAAPTGMLNGAAVFTIEFRIKTTESRSSGTYWQRPTMLGDGSSGNASGDFGITTDNGYIGMWGGLNSGGDNYFLSNTLQVNNNAWHHIAAVNNGSTINLFVDGVNVGNISSGTGLVTSAAPLTIGGSSLDFGFSGNVGNTNFFHQGEYDEVRFSNSVRYTGNFTVPAAPFTSDGNTIALYHLDGCTNGLVPDASPNANNGTPRNFTGSCALMLPSPPTIPANPAATNIQKAEYFFDADPGFGAAPNLPVPTSTDVSINNYSVNIAALSTGSHRLYVRTKDTKNWSVTNTTPFFIVPVSVVLPANAAPANITAAEYFFDTDFGFGSGTSLPIPTGMDVTGNFTISLSSLDAGVHRLYIRTKDMAAKWSITNIATFYKLPTIVTIPAGAAPSNIVKAEYYLDIDPGFGNGTNIPVTAGMDVMLNNIFVNISNLSNGVHYLHIRTKDAVGNWSQNDFANFSIVAASVILPANPVPGDIIKFEYFFDTDPGFGHGQTVSVSNTTNLQNFSFVADVSSLSNGQHMLFIRSYDGWSITTVRSFSKGVVLPVTWLSFIATNKTDSVLLNWQTTNEINNHHFVVERSADGKNFTTIGTVAAAHSSAATFNYQLADKQPLPGISYYRIRQVDTDGKEKYSAVIAVRFGKQNGSIVIYPNPAKDVLRISFATAPAPGTVVEIINAAGQRVKAVAVNGQSFITVDVASLPNGMYQVKMNGSTELSQKIVVQH